ncbi:MAG: MerR family transcriptional regulator [Acidobacteriota bacterium]|nr:MerR family transcriptional regulator [Acidobacteriota bacterium]MDE3139773.1 MerR family transcriptional regulator [Acidobacteriota bacterium]
MDLVMIGQLSKSTGLSVRTLRFYADEGLLPVSGRTESGYRVFAADAVARARLLRTLRELGVGLEDVRRVLDAEASLTDVAVAHVAALDAQVRLVRLQQTVLRIFIQSNDLKELQLMTDLTTLSAEERRRIVDEYLDAVFGDDPHAVAEKLRMGTPELPDDPSPDQVAAWVEVVHLLRDPDFVESSRRMAQRALAEGPEPDVAQFEVGKAVGTLAGPAMRAGVDPGSPEALAVVEGIEAVGSSPAQDRLAAADRIDAFTDRRVGRYWTLVGIINGWRPSEAPADIIDSWEWYARALRAHA